MLRVALLTLGLIFAQTCQAQDYSAGRLGAGLAPQPTNCFIKAAEQLEPLQDAMFDLTNLIVHSICLGEIYRWMNSSEHADAIDKQATIDSQVRLVGQIVAAARMKRLGIEYE